MGEQKDNGKRIVATFCVPILFLVIFRGFLCLLALIIALPAHFIFHADEFCHSLGDLAFFNTFNYDESWLFWWISAVVICIIEYFIWED